MGETENHPLSPFHLRLYRGGHFIVKINEVEELLQISKANIRFYEKEGLKDHE